MFVSQAHPGLQSMPQDSWSCREKPCLKTNKQTNKQTNSRTQYKGLGQKTYLLNKQEELRGNWIKNFYLALLLERLSQRDSGLKACPRNLVRPYLHGLRAGIVAQRGRTVIQYNMALGFIPELQLIKPFLLRINPTTGSHKCSFGTFSNLFISGSHDHVNLRKIFHSSHNML